MRRFGLAIVFLILVAGSARAAAPATRPATAQTHKTVYLKAPGVPSIFRFDVASEASRAVNAEFHKRYPWIEPVSITSLNIPMGGESAIIVPFMQIAGGIAPDVLYVNFKMSQTYIDKKLLYPLDEYLEKTDGVTISDGSALDTEHYIAALKKGKNWASVNERVAPMLWKIIRRRCPYGVDCPYRKAHHLPPLAKHFHVWCYPTEPIVMGLVYDRTMFAEHAGQGVEMRPPRTWDEMLRWAKIMTDPARGEYGLGIETEKLPAWHFVSILYSAGGRVVQEDKDGNWHCVVNSDAAADALYFYCRLRLEKVTHGNQTFRGVVSPGGGGQTFQQFAMSFEYLDDQFLAAAPDRTKGIGPLPAGPHGTHGAEFNSGMYGIFAGLAGDSERRDAAWDYINFSDSTDAKRIRVRKLVEAGVGPFVRKSLLEQFNTGGQYDAVIRRCSPDIEKIFEQSFKEGVPEPYGKNCQYVYDELNRPIGEALHDPTILRAIDTHNPALARPVIKRILQKSKEQIDSKLLGILPPSVQRRNNIISWIVIALVVIIFSLVLRKVFVAFTPEEFRRPVRKRRREALPRGAEPRPLATVYTHKPRDPNSERMGQAPPSEIDPNSERIGQAPPTEIDPPVSSSTAVALPPGSLAPARAIAPPSVWSFRKYRMAYLLMLPALASIALWLYYPVFEGTVIAFQQYSVLGGSKWIGAQNFAAVLFSAEFWHSVKISLIYAALYFAFGFWVPIALAFLLQEVPRGKTFFRTVYYLPAVLSGLVVIFLWKQFYAPDGLMNDAYNSVIGVLNLLPHVHLMKSRSNWLDDPHWALFLTLLPTVWAGMGPGCLIYLAALKTVPEEMYEAADIDGAGLWRKVFSVAVPAIRALITINFIGAMIGAVRGASSFVLAMTAGGPYTSSGGATMVFGLRLFFTTFGYLEFGVGSAMAWVLGSMLIGFTVLQLQRLSRYEFRTADTPA